MTKSAPLEGLKVLDVSSVLSGPLTTMLLADLGAGKIGIDSPQADRNNAACNNNENGQLQVE